MRSPAFDEALAGVRRSFSDGRLGQAYIVEGSTQGDGLDFAYAVISMLYCESGGCGHCSHCRRVTDRTHPDVMWIEPQKKSRRISIKQVRDADGQIFQSAFEGGWKVCVFVGADRIGVEGANAFLKTLEEPPPKTLFLLLSGSPQSLLPTIVSRCQRIHLSRHAEGLPPAVRTALLDIIRSSAGEGSLARSAYASRLVNLLKEIKETVEAAVHEEAESEGREETKDTMVGRVESRYRGLRRDVLQSVLLWERDVLMLTTHVDPSLLHFQDCIEDVRERAAQTTTADVLKTIAAIQHIDVQLERNMSEVVTFQNAFLH